MNPDILLDKGMYHQSIKDLNTGKATGLKELLSSQTGVRLNCSTDTDVSYHISQY